MFKGLVTKTVKDMVIDPIMNPGAPAAPAEQAPAEPKVRSEFDPDAFDQVEGSSGSAFDPDSFDQAPVRRAAATPTRHEADPAAARALIAETWDIHLPFYPGEGTACGDQCQCTWLIEKHWSPENGCNAIFATWVLSGGDTACTDCRARGEEWSDVFVRPAFDD